MRTQTGRWISVGLLIIVSTAVAALADSQSSGVRPESNHASPVSTSTLFATDRGSASTYKTPVSGIAAMVDGHAITTNEVETICLRNERSYVVDQMIQSYVLDRACRQLGIMVTDGEIDKRIEDLRRQVAPDTIAQTLQKHSMSVAELRTAYRQSIERQKLIGRELKPVRMLHCREILIKCTPANEDSEAKALSLLKSVQEDLGRGADFGTLADKYSELSPDKSGGDIGVLYAHMLNVDSGVLTAAMTLSKGAVTHDPVRTADGYCLIQATSTNSDYAASEKDLYRDAGQAAGKVQAMFLEPAVIGNLIRKSRITYATDEDFEAGKTLPVAAAVVDGHPILTKDVLVRCLAATGPSTVDVLVQDYVVDRECSRRGIVVSEAEIDQRVDDLARQIAPSTIADGLLQHHMTMARLRYDFRQEIERTKLAIGQVNPTAMVHARVIFVSDSVPSPGDAPEAASGLMAKITQELKAGASFEALANRYSELGDRSKGGDVGILYQGKPGMDTAVLNTALGMKVGETTLIPVQTYNAHFLVLVASTSGNHGRDEDAAYAAAQDAYRQQEAQKLTSSIVIDLIKASKIVYYLHA